MKLTLIGHDDRYAVEQLQMALFPDDTSAEAVSTLHRGDTWLTATTKITLNGRTVTRSRRLRADRETVRLRRRCLQQSYYLAALEFLPEPPAWGALAGVRPTKLTTKHLLEGGRPDTLDLEKLRAIRSHGADRMSINPQTMEDAVLRACGRPHKSGDVLRAYDQAVAAGFRAVNMDLIAGLPRDSFDGFRRSLESVAALRPANITVHTLALKKGADLFERREDLPTAEQVRAMVDWSSDTLRALGYKPYYLYRQKYMSGSFENTGWSRDGLDCLYNIYMMEEVHTILSLGGGGMNKLNFPDGSLRRFHNPKFPEQYIEMLDTVLRQKRDLFALMDAPACANQS